MPPAPGSAPLGAGYFPSPRRSARPARERCSPKARFFGNGLDRPAGETWLIGQLWDKKRPLRSRQVIKASLRATLGLPLPAPSFLASLQGEFSGSQAGLAFLFVDE